jgi:iron complex outermembrane recepter protein
MANRFLPACKRPTPPIALAVALGASVWSGLSAAQTVGHLADLSLRELSDLEVTSVSKSSELLRQAPASIYVITHDEILRSGATSIPEALRLAPNLQIAQYTSSRYVAGARGFAGAEESQNFSNKLLVLIDGRSVYTPLYSGVYLDVQDVLLEDIDRIEVISGPGATLWGANAMNGVINIITRPSYLTDQSFASAGAGDQQRSMAARYGTKINGALSLRTYAKAFERDALELAHGESAGDDWRKAQAGFRLDWNGAEDTYTAQGDVYRGTQSQRESDHQRIQGANLVGRWQHRTKTGEWQLQAYYDYTQREQPVGGVGFDLHTFDLELQNNTTRGVHRFVWGAGLRVHSYDISDASALIFDPNDRTLTLGNAFVQDTIGLGRDWDLTLGLKGERDSYSGWNPLPDVRLAWRINEDAMWWLAGSRAIRSPTPFDVDVRELSPDGILFIEGNAAFKTEKVNAFESGLRVQPSAALSLSTSVFYDEYNDLRTIEVNRTTGFLPFTWGNEMQGYTYGAEFWAKWQVTTGWRLAPGARWVNKSHLEFSSRASGFGGLSQSGNDPKYQLLLTSSADLTPQLSFDATLRYVDDLPAPALESYYELNASLGWRPSAHLNVSLTGQNLLNPSHLEYPLGNGEYIERSVFVLARWTF